MEHGGVERLKTDHKNAASAIHNCAKRSRRINRALAAIAVSAGIMFGLAEKDPQNSAALAAEGAGAVIGLTAVGAIAGDDILFKLLCTRIVTDYGESRDLAGTPGERIELSIKNGDLHETKEVDEKADPELVRLKGLYGRFAGPIAPLAVGTSFLVDADANPVAKHVSPLAGGLLAGGVVAAGLGLTILRDSAITAQEQSYLRQLDNIDGPASISVANG